VVALLMACAFSAGQPGMGYEDQDQETITFDCNQPFCYEGFLEYVEEDDEPEEGQRALHLVARRGPPALLFLLLVAGAQVDAQNDDGNTALMLACANRHEAAAAELMEATKRAGALDLQGGHYKHSALHMASEEGLAGTVAQLLALGADAALTDKNGNTALMLACATKHEAAAAELMEATKRAGALDLQAGRYKRSALHAASAMGMAGTVAQLLALGADAGLKDTDGNTALELAHDTGTFECLRAAGAKMPDITDENKNALLLRSAENGVAPLVRAVLQAGADAAHTNQNTPWKRPALHWAAIWGHDSSVGALVQARADVNAVDGGKHSALHFAAMKLHASSVGALVQAKADVNAVDSQGHTPLFWAKENSWLQVHTEVVRLLEAAGGCCKR